MSLYLDNAIQMKLADAGFRRKNFAYLSDSAFRALELIGRGGRILRRHADGKVDIVYLPVPRHPRNPDGTSAESLKHPICIARLGFQELLERGLISALDRNTSLSRTGWKDMGLSGEPGMEFYLCAQ